MIEVEQIMLAQIEGLKRQLAEALAMLRDHRLSMKKNGNPARRFFNERPIDAMRVVLEENGGRMRRVDLEKALIEGGLLVGKSRKTTNIKESYKKNSGTLIIDGEYVEIHR
jgi:hypothetical protein